MCGKEIEHFAPRQNQEMKLLKVNKSMHGIS
jgi:hypothetical protein